MALFIQELNQWVLSSSGDLMVDGDSSGNPIEGYFYLDFYFDPVRDNDFGTYVASMGTLTNGKGVIADWYDDTGNGLNRLRITDYENGSPVGPGVDHGLIFPAGEEGASPSGFEAKNAEGVVFSGLLNFNDGNQIVGIYLPVELADGESGIEFSYEPGDLTETTDADLASSDLVKYAGIDDFDGPQSSTPLGELDSNQAARDFDAAVSAQGKDLRIYTFEYANSGNFAGASSTYLPAPLQSTFDQTGAMTDGTASGGVTLDAYLDVRLFNTGNGVSGDPSSGDDPGVATNEGNDADRGYNQTITGDQYLEVLPGNDTSGGVVLDISGQVTGIGFYLMGREETKRDVFADIYLSDGRVVRQLTDVHPLGEGGQQFLGYLLDADTDPGVTLVRVVLFEPAAGTHSGDSRDIFALDDIRLVVPEGEGRVETQGEDTGTGGGEVTVIGGGDDHVWFYPSSSDDIWAQNRIQGTELDDTIDADALAGEVPLTRRDWIDAGAGDDHVLAGQGGDWISGGAGDDTLDGGESTVAERLDPENSQNVYVLENRANYSGPANRYNITQALDADGSVTGLANQVYFSVEDLRSGSPDGTDIVFNLDALQFNDKEIRLTPSYGFNMDWQQPGVFYGLNAEGGAFDDVMGAVPGDEAAAEAFAGSDRLVGQAGNDSLHGGAGPDTLRGDKGDDRLDGGGNRSEDSDGQHEWNGAFGVDVAEYSGNADRYTITLTDAQGQPVAGFAEDVVVTVTDSKGAKGDGTDTLTGIEVLRFADGELNLAVVSTAQYRYELVFNPETGLSDWLPTTLERMDWRGTNYADTIDGTSGRDEVRAGAGDDLISTGDQGDRIEGGEGDDSLNGGANGDSENTWENQDVAVFDAPIHRFNIELSTDDNGMRVFSVTDKLADEFGGLGSDRLVNIEQIQFSEGQLDLQVRYEPAREQWQSTNNINGTVFDDTIDADFLRANLPEEQSPRDYDNIRADSGNDVVFAGAGGDSIIDGYGDDFYDGGADGNDPFNPWNNSDRVQFQGAQKRYTIDVLNYADLAADDPVKALIDGRYPEAENRPNDLVRVTDKLPASSGGDGVNVLINVEQIQFQDGQVSLGVSESRWQPGPDWTPDGSVWQGNNNYNGGILDDLIDARDHDALGAMSFTLGEQGSGGFWQSSSGWFSNRDGIQGDAGNDTLYGGAGGDELAGGKGDDLLIGGANGQSANAWDNLDRARFTHSINRYEIEFYRPAAEGEIATHNALGLTTGTDKAYVFSGYYHADGLIVVTDRYSDALGGEGRDVLHGIESLNFSDAWETLSVDYSDSTWNQPLWNEELQQYIETPVENRWAWGTRFGDQLVGLPNATNNLQGNAGDDYIIGGNLRDELSGGMGNDTIDAGDNPVVDPTRPWDTWNKYDVVRFDAEASQFAIDRLIDSTGELTGQVGQTYYQVEHLIPARLGGLGTDIVINAERLQFSDGDMPLNVKIEQRPEWDDNLHQSVTRVFYQGTAFDDVITGTVGDDSFMGEAGDDTLNGGDGHDNLGAGAGNDSLLGGAGDDKFVNLNTGNDSVVGGDGTDSVQYEDALSRYTVTLMRGDNAVATFTKENGFGAATYDPTTDSLTVRDRLSDALGGEGTDSLSSVERISFNDGEINLATGQFEPRNSTGFTPDTNFEVNTASVVLTPPAFPELAVQASVWATDNTDHVLPEASHLPIITLFGKDFWAFKSLDDGSGTIDLPDGVTIAGYSALRFEFGDLELSDLQVVALDHSTETWTDTDADAAYFRLYGDDGDNEVLIATGDDMQIQAITDTDPTSPTFTLASGSLTVTLQATAADQGFVRKLTEAQNGVATVTLALDDFASEAPPDYGPERDEGNAWQFDVTGALDTEAFNLLPVWTPWHMDKAPVFVAGNNVTIDLGLYAVDPEGETVSYQAMLGYQTDDVFEPLETPVTLSIVDNRLSGNFNAPDAVDGEPNLVLRVLAYDDPGQLHGAHIDLPFMVVQAGADAVAGGIIVGTEGDDSLNAGSGNDQLDGGAGDDQLNGGAGNDTLDGGSDSVTLGTNFWGGGGDVANYFGAPRQRFEIVSNDDGSMTIIDLASINQPSFDADGRLLASAYDAAEDVSAEIGFGVDTLIGVERIHFSDDELQLTPMDRAYTYRSRWWDGSEEREYDVTRHDITGTFLDDLLVGSAYGDQLDGRSGDDTLDGGVEALEQGNAWEIQDVVRYTGSRERYEIQGVLVDKVTDEDGPHYNLVAPAAANGDELFGIIVSDVLPASAGGTGRDLLVNIERIEFAWTGSGDNSIALAPELHYQEDWSIPVAEGQPRPQALNARGTVFDDAFSGTENNDWLYGNDGNDTLIGGAGGDDLEGGKGNDLLLGGANGLIDQWGGARTDTARFNAGFDRFEISTIQHDLDGDAETTDDIVSAIQVADILPASDTSSLGTDILIGVENLAFNDRWLEVTVRRWEWIDWQGVSNVNAEGTAFGDIILGDRTLTNEQAEAATRDFMRGNAGNDVLVGAGNGDNLSGGEGHDVLDGGDNGNTGDAWQDQDTAQFSGDSNRYLIQNIRINADEDAPSSFTILADDAEIASFDSDGLTVTATDLGEGVETVLASAYANLDLGDGQHNVGYLVVDTLSADLGGDGADLVFNVESLWFANGPLDLEIRASANDWDGDNHLDGVWVTGTGGNDEVTIAQLAELTGRSAEDIQASHINAELREGDDTYLGGDGGEWIRAGKGNDYIDGGANSGVDAWGGVVRDEAYFGAKFSRYTLIDVSLNKDGDTWTLSSGKLAMNAASVTLDVAPNSLPVDQVNAAIQNFIEHAAADATQVKGWIVADRLPGEFGGSGIDALVNVEAISFNDKWLPLEMQVNYQRQWWDPEADDFETIIRVNVQGTSGDDLIAADEQYDFSGNDQLEGNEGNDTIQSGAGADWLRGGMGDDTLDGGANGDVDQWGNKQFDTARYDGDYDRYIITTENDDQGQTWTLVTDTDDESGDGVDHLINVEALSFNDRWIRLDVETYVWTDGEGLVSGVNVNGALLDDVIDASQDDYPGVQHHIQGNEGNDTLIGGDGPDQLNGGMGDDQIVGGGNGVDPWGNPGFDSVFYDGDSSRYTIEIIKPNGTDANGTSFNGQSFSINEVTYTISEDGITADGEAADDVKIVRVTDSFSEEDGGNGVDLLIGIENIGFWNRWITLEMAQSFTDLDSDGNPDAGGFTGTDDNDTLVGGDLNDGINGGAGDDSISGGLGGDILNGGEGNDTLDGGEDGIERDGRVLVDLAKYEGDQADYAVTQQTDAEGLVTGSVGALYYTVTDSNPDDGSDGTDTLFGIEGIQFADGFVSLSQTTDALDRDADGSDDYFIVRGVDVVDDLIDQSGNTDEMIVYRLEGGGGDDQLTGGAGGDVLVGGAGDDSLVGGANPEQRADQAIYLGNLIDYTVTEQPDGSYIVTSLIEGADHLSGIEELLFADQIMKLGASALEVSFVEVDTDGDKLNDQVLWTGTAQPDVIHGEQNRTNVMESLAGDDELIGGDLADTFKLGEGDDTVDGGASTGMNANGDPMRDVVIYEGAKSEYAVNAVQSSQFTLTGSVEAGDVFSVTLGADSVSYTASEGDDMASVLAKLDETIEALGGMDSPTFRSVESAVDDEGVGSLTVVGENIIFAVQASISNGEHAIEGSYTVYGANQSGSSLVIAAATLPEVGMFVRYDVNTSSTGEDGQQTTVTTTYGPYEITAVNSSSKTLTLDQSLGATPANGATLSITETNALDDGLVGETVYDRWFEVGTETETDVDVLRNIEALVFADDNMALNAVESSQASWGEAGIEVLQQLSGTDLADLLWGTEADEVFQGGEGSDHFILADSSGSDQILDFVAGENGDVITLNLGLDDIDSDGNGVGGDGINATGIDTVSELLANASDEGGSTRVDLGAGNSLYLLGIDVSTLVSANFEVVTGF